MLGLPQIKKRGHLGERCAIACGVLVGHALVLLLIGLPRQAQVSTQIGNYGQIAMISFADMPSPKVISPSAKPSSIKPLGHEPVVAEELLFNDELELLSPEDMSEPRLSPADAAALAQFEPASAQGESNVPCQLTATLAGIFAQNPLVQSGLEALPASQRSVANAVMLWDGQWSEDTLTGGKAVLRALLVKAVASGRADCLTQINRGPVLFLVPDRQVTAVLAIGSGEWTWGDLLKTEDAAVLTATASNYLKSPASRFGSEP